MGRVSIRCRGVMWRHRGDGNLWLIVAVRVRGGCSVRSTVVQPVLCTIVLQTCSAWQYQQLASVAPRWRWQLVSHTCTSPWIQLPLELGPTAADEGRGGGHRGGVLAPWQSCCPAQTAGSASAGPPTHALVCCDVPMSTSCGYSCLEFWHHHAAVLMCKAACCAVWCGREGRWHGRSAAAHSSWSLGCMCLMVWR
jgi:hypothetical protein